MRFFSGNALFFIFSSYICHVNVTIQDYYGKQERFEEKHQLHLQ